MTHSARQAQPPGHHDDQPPPAELPRPRAAAPHRAERPRPFLLVRVADPSGVSGTGAVAEGCLFTSGKVALNWRSEIPSSGIYDCIDDVLTVHGHHGASRIHWLD